MFENVRKTGAGCEKGQGDAKKFESHVVMSRDLFIVCQTIVVRHRDRSNLFLGEVTRFARSAFIINT